MQSGKRRAATERTARSSDAPADGLAAGTRERLLRAAAEVIQESGWSAASVVTVAERAGLAAGTLYRHFPSKAELFVEVIRAVSQRELGAMLAAQGAKAHVAERFDAVVATYARRALHNRRLAWALVYEPVDALVDAERLAYRRAYREGMAALLREGIASGALPPQDPDLAAAAVVGIIAETLVGPLSPLGRHDVPDADIIASIVAFCRRAVGLAPARAKRRRA
jgi:AcrR family transcriptional regulator